MPENYTYDIACSGLAASGAVSSAISSITTGICEVKINSKGWTAAITIAAGGLSGGITSTIAGGDFWDGLCNGLICAGLNHAMHLVAEGGSPDDPPGKTKQVKDSEESADGKGNATTAAGITSTMIGEAASWTIGVNGKSILLEGLRDGGKISGRTFGGINIAKNFRMAYHHKISWSSAIRRSIVGGIEIAVSEVAPFLSISLSAFDAGGGFENNFYNDEWCKGFFDRSSSYQLKGTDYYHHGF